LRIFARTLVFSALAFSSALSTASAQERLDLWTTIPRWAMGIPDDGIPPPGPKDAVTKLTIPGSSKSFTQAEIDDGFNTPIWFPETTPAMPDIVAKGRPPTVRACALCHLTSGLGHPESSSLAGLPVNYFLEQMESFKDGRRTTNLRNMIDLSKVISPEESRAAAEWFAKLKPAPWIKVVETDTVPHTYVKVGGMRLVKKGGGTEPLGNRILEVPEDEVRVERRDPTAGFLVWVPKGSVAKGKELVETGGDGKTMACGLCHGKTMKGLGDIPSIAGRSPVYVGRQLFAIQNGARYGGNNALMTPVVEKLDETDIVNISAYLASLEP